MTPPPAATENELYHQLLAALCQRGQPVEIWRNATGFAELRPPSPEEPTAPWVYREVERMSFHEQTLDTRTQQAFILQLLLQTQPSPTPLSRELSLREQLLLLLRAYGTTPPEQPAPTREEAPAAPDTAQPRGWAGLETMGYSQRALALFGALLQAAEEAYGELSVYNGPGGGAVLLPPAATPGETAWLLKERLRTGRRRVIRLTTGQRWQTALDMWLLHNRSFRDPDDIAPAALLERRLRIIQPEHPLLQGADPAEG